MQAASSSAIFLFPASMGRLSMDHLPLWVSLMKLLVYLFFQTLQCLFKSSNPTEKGRKPDILKQIWHGFV
jgi:hypothetical protein